MECLEWEPGSDHSLWPRVAPSFPQKGEMMQSREVESCPWMVDLGLTLWTQPFLPAGSVALPLR